MIGYIVSTINREEGTLIYAAGGGMTSEDICHAMIIPHLSAAKMEADEYTRNVRRSGEDIDDFTITSITFSVDEDL